ncbi:hypothetical protein KVH22_25130 [Streptomyces olivaceus]|uniref:hypothetical protein n=1 Tax=Streptomyces olivaceus TaxID=47716 RepID=UPI001CCBFCAE|nr:hypothetical protein [Streptomyces olivaceus]MBZ6258801.1 hypothetical protein [Streptomyces olivaceus]
MSPEERRLRAQLGAEVSWANTVDRAARTAPGARAAEARFHTQAREMHPDASEEQLAKVAENLRRAHFRRLSLAAATARRKKAEARKAGASA